MHMCVREKTGGQDRPRLEEGVAIDRPTDRCREREGARQGCGVLANHVQKRTGEAAEAVDGIDVGGLAVPVCGRKWAVCRV